MTEENKNKGALQAALDRSGNQVRGERAKQIADSARLTFRRKIEDLTYDLNEARARQDTMLDMSPDNALSIINAKDFDRDKFVKESADLAAKIFNETQRLNVYIQEYERLFGEKPQISI